MNARTLGIFVLLVAALGLGVGLYLRHNKAVEEKKSDIAAIQQLSNQWVNTQELLEEQQRVNATLDTNVTILDQQVRKYSNNVVALSSNLSDVEARAKAAAEEAAAEIKKRDERIAGLEEEIDEQTQKMLELTGNIDKLNVSIAETERKLAASEGDREFLLTELQRLQAEKASLERQLNDLAFLRQQVRHLRDELAVSKRLEMIRKGIYNVMKGGERLKSGIKQPTAVAATNKGNFDLNVEVTQDGKAVVVPPTPGATNPGARTNITPLPDLSRPPAATPAATPTPTPAPAPARTPAPTPPPQ
jgi:predicted  nucleic acid-binding Zn-ribbon protein